MEPIFNRVLFVCPQLWHVSREMNCPSVFIFIPNPHSTLFFDCIDSLVSLLSGVLFVPLVGVLVSPFCADPMIPFCRLSVSHRGVEAGLGYVAVCFMMTTIITVRCVPLFSARPAWCCCYRWCSCLMLSSWCATFFSCDNCTSAFSHWILGDVDSHLAQWQFWWVWIKYFSTKRKSAQEEMGRAAAAFRRWFQQFFHFCGRQAIEVYGQCCSARGAVDDVDQLYR